MPDYRELKSGVLVPKSHQTPKRERLRDMRGAYRNIMPPAGGAHSLYYISPDRQGEWRLSKSTLDSLQNKPISQVLDLLLQNSPDMNMAIQIYTQSIIQGYEIGGDDDVRMVIEEFLEKLGMGGTPFIMQLMQMVRTMLIEGAFCGKLMFDEAGEEPVEIRPYSPLSLRFRPAEDARGKLVWLIYYYEYPGKYELLYDPRDPDPRFVYLPIRKSHTTTYNTYGATGTAFGQPYGTCPVAPAIFGELTLTGMINMIYDYIRGQAFPKGVISVDGEDFLDREDFSAEEIEDRLDSAVAEIQANLNSADVSQSMVLDTKVIYTLIGALGRTRLDGADMFINIIERRQQRAYMVPRSLYGSMRQGNVLSDHDQNVEWFAFQSGVQHYRFYPTFALNHWFKVILRHKAIMKDATLELDDSDKIGYGLNSERLKVEAETYSTYLEDRIMDRQEVRSIILASDQRFSELPTELPDTIAEKEMSAMPNPSDTEGDEDDDMGADQNGNHLNSNTNPQEIVHGR